MKTISIVIPSHRRNAYLQQLLDGIERFPSDLWAHIDLTVIGDAESLANVKSPHAQFLTRPHLGITDAWNACIDATRGQYLLLFHDDDLLPPALPITYLQAISHYPTAALICSYPLKIDAAGNPRGDLHILAGTHLYEPPSLYKRLVKQNCIAAPGACIQRACLETVGHFRNYQYALDYDMWLRIARRFPVLYIDQPLSYYRIHPNQLTERIPATQKREEETELFRQLLLDECEYYEEIPVEASH